MRPSAIASLAIAAALVVCLALGVAATPLDDYIKRPEPMFAYADTGVRLGGALSGYVGYLYNFTSQQWLTPADSSRPVWQHQLLLIVPNNYVPSPTAFLYITGGSNPFDSKSIKETSTDVLIASIVAQKAKSAAAILFQIPNEKISFPSDPVPGSDRTEDSLIALTWYKYVHGSSAEWILELPMTKAAVKALDVMQAVLPILTKNVAAASQFVVAGASKRGWTTWLTGVVDPRVVAIVPIVLDALDMRAFLHRQFRMYGGYSFALQPYVELNITQDIDSPAVHDLFTIIDPIFYADRLTMPKLMVSAGGDEFQMPDDQRYWRSQMVGEMNFLVVKNAEHSEITGIFEILPAVGAFVESIIAHRPRPTMQWKIDDATGNITMVTDTVPKSVTIAVADSAGDVSTGKRDFRWAALNVSFCPIKVFGGCVRPIVWGTFPLAASTPDQLTYVAGVPLPAAPAYRAFMIEVKWANPSGGDDFEFTTGVSVVPNTFPFADCTTPAQCRGTLL